MPPLNPLTLQINIITYHHTNLYETPAPFNTVLKKNTEFKVFNEEHALWEKVYHGFRRKILFVAPLRFRPAKRVDRLRNAIMLAPQRWRCALAKRNTSVTLQIEMCVLLIQIRLYF